MVDITLIMSSTINMNEFLDAIDESYVPDSNVPAHSEKHFYSTAPVRFSGGKDLFTLSDFLVTVEAKSTHKTCTLTLIVLASLVVA